MPVLAYGILFFVSFLFGSLPFIGAFRALPRWIRIALLMIGLSFFYGAAFGIALNAAAPRLSPQMYAFLYAHKMIIFGVGVGIIERRKLKVGRRTFFSNAKTRRE